MGAVRRALTHPLFLTSFVLAFAIFAAFLLTGTVSRAVRSDGWGYFLHLPAAVIYGDLKLTFLNDPNLPESIRPYWLSDHWQGLRPNGDGFLNKYAAGVAVLELPFFLIALPFARLLYPEVTGFEAPFQWSGGVAAAFYFALGVYLCYRAARLRYGVSASLLSVGFAAFATNLLFYATFDASYSHVFGFFLVAGISFLTVRRVEAGGAPLPWEFALFGLLLGLAVAVRPTNAIVGLLFLVLVRKSDLPTITRGTLLVAAASLAAASPQMIAWFITTGQPIYYGYVGEGFRFGSPEIRNYLLSIRKGVFFWHPAYLLMLLAALAQIPARRLEGIVVATILFLNLYIGASWSDYTFGGSFGCRQIVDMGPLLILPTAGAIERLWTTRWRLPAAGVALALVVLNTIYFRGYVVGTLPNNNTNQQSYIAFWKTTLGLK